MFDKTTERGITICTIVPLLVTGTGHSMTTTVTSSHACNGKEQTPVTAITNGALPATDYNTGLAFPSLTGSTTGGQGCVVVYAFKEGATGADVNDVRCMQGPKQSLDASGNFLTAPQFPAIPNDVCPFAYQVLKHYGTASSVTFGTSDWNATGFHNAIVRCKQLPIPPQIA